VPLLPLGPSCPLQTILLGYLVGYDSLLLIVMTVWRAFLKFEGHQPAILVSRRLSHPICLAKKYQLSRDTVFKKKEKCENQSKK
jgi:hypothetical protein